MAMAIPQRTPWYIVPLRFIRAVFQIRRFPGLAFAILVFLLVIPSLFAELIAPHDPIKGSLGARLKPPMWAPGGSTNYPIYRCCACVAGCTGAAESRYFRPARVR